MSIPKLRKRIDSVDAKIISLLNERARMSLVIGEEKKKNQKGIYAPDREKQVLERIKKLNKGPMTASALDAVYREVMSSSLSLEKSLKIAYLGPQASFTHLAARKKFGSQVKYIPCGDIPEIFDRVEKKDCDYGVVPIENSIEGAVTHTLDPLADSDLKICAQITLEISHNLLSKYPLERIRQVYSKDQVFGQCRNWLHRNLPHAELIEVSSTTKAAQIAAKKKNSACIASALAAQTYNLRIVKSGIEDFSHNMTRFLVIGMQDVPPTGKDRTSLLFSIKDKVGALHDMLLPFSRNKINLTKIESRPSKKRAWDYYFFVDCEGHQLDKKVQRALKELEKKSKYLKILGSYPV
ncbi:MAG: prephenate dehydratase [Candidatus Omnitrophica bacterium]|nr:prephenate dehydratase [Candidatus Omnitrophota bacterium]